MSDPIHIDDFKVISPKVKGYELQPGKHYLIVADGKKFNFPAVHKLMQSLRDEHPELSIHIIATIAPEGLSVMEKKDLTSFQSGEI